MGAIAQKTGPRLPMTIGPAIAAVGLALLGQIEAGDQYVTAVLPGVLLFGLGMSMTVAPLTAAVLGAVEERHLGIASATNNAVARLAGLLAVAIIPLVAGFELTVGAVHFRATRWQCGSPLRSLCPASVIAFLTIGRGRQVSSVPQPIGQSCQSPALVASSRR